MSTNEHMSFSVFKGTFQEILRVLKPTGIFIGTLDLTFEK